MLIDNYIDNDKNINIIAILREDLVVTVNYLVLLFFWQKKLIFIVKLY